MCWWECDDKLEVVGTAERPCNDRGQEDSRGRWWEKLEATGLWEAQNVRSSRMHGVRNGA